MRNPRGYALTVDPDAPTRERDTITCGHCNGIAEVPPGQQPSDKCRMCMRFVCERCAGMARCSPFEKKLEIMERSDRLRSAV